MSEMIGEFPALHQTIVAERDIYLTHKLRQATHCVESPSNGQSVYCIFPLFAITEISVSELIISCNCIN